MKRPALLARTLAESHSSLMQFRFPLISAPVRPIRAASVFFDLSFVSHINMNRRSFVGSAAAVSLAALSTAAIAAEEHQHGDHAAAKAAPNPYDAARLAAAHCLSAGQVCLDHCIRQLSKGDTSMAQCAKSVNQMLALCGALQSLAAQNSALTPALAKVCAKACKECADACKEHAAHHAECKACHESCLACIKECEKIAA